MLLQNKDVHLLMLLESLRFMLGLVILILFAVGDSIHQKLVFGGVTIVSVIVVLFLFADKKENGFHIYQSFASQYIRCVC